MDLDFEALRDACFGAAKRAMWDVRPTDVAKIKDLGNTFFTIAMSHVSRIMKQGRDPNTLVRAVSYLANTHAIPPMHDSREWFIFMLAALIELSCPDCPQTAETIKVFSDIEAGIAEVRRQLDSGQTALPSGTEDPAEQV